MNEYHRSLAILVGITFLGVVFWNSKWVFTSYNSDDTLEWVYLKTGETFSQRDVPDCNETNGQHFLVKQMTDEVGTSVSVATCTVFGDGIEILFLNRGRAKELGQIVRDNPKSGLVWPEIPWQLEGQVWDYTKTKFGWCIDPWAIDPNGHAMGADTGLRYRFKKEGKWSDWFPRPEVHTTGSIVHWVSDVEVATPDGFPRSMGRGQISAPSVANGNVPKGYLLFCISEKH